MYGGKVISGLHRITSASSRLKPGEHTVSTESEFSDNAFKFVAESGKNHFIRQYIKLGVFVGGANVELVTEKEGKEGVLAAGLAK